MAFVTTHQFAPASIIDRASAALASFTKARHNRRVIRNTLAELRGLSDRELLDLGLSRSNLLEVAQQSVNNK